MVSTKSSEFRRWCTELWFQHVDEVVIWTGAPPDYTARQYFRNYKWWLKREFLHTTKNYE